MSHTNKSLISNLPIFIKPFNLKNSLALKFIWFLIFLITILDLGFLIYQFNLYAASIYFINQYEKKINQLTQENRILEVELAKNSSLVNLGQYVQNFEKSNKIEYIRILNGTALAK